MDNFTTDPLKIYFGDPYPITDNIIVRQPTIQDIIEYGEDRFFSMLFIFIGNTTYRKLFLWNNGIDWNKLSDFELFCNFAPTLKQEDTEVIFGDLDFSKFDIFARNDFEPEPEPTAPPGKKVRAIDKYKYKMRMYDKSHVLYDEETYVMITADDYYKIRKVLQDTVLIYPKTEYASSKLTKELLIEEEIDLIKKIERERKGQATSTLLPLISFCVNHPGFKYKTQELRSVGIAEFMDSVKRLQLYESTRALLNGSMSGMCDMSKVPPERFDFTRNLNSKS
jgi:hypothetical protein